MAHTVPSEKITSRDISIVDALGPLRWLSGKESACQHRRRKRHRFDLWVGSPGEGNGNSLQYPCLRNPMDRGAWQVQPMGSLGIQSMGSQSRRLVDWFYFYIMSSMLLSPEI